jgi:hypothetical protein
MLNRIFKRKTNSAKKKKTFFSTKIFHDLGAATPLPFAENQLQNGNHATTRGFPHARSFIRPSGNCQISTAPQQGLFERTIY